MISVKEHTITFYCTHKVSLLIIKMALAVFTVDEVVTDIKKN